MSKNISNVILRSVNHNETVTLDANSDREEALREECDGHVQSGLVHEFWGTTEDGGEWRIHLVYDCDEQAAAPYSEVES